MTLRDDIAALRARIARARSDRDAGRAAGSQDKYVAASCVAATLELQLEQMRQEGLRTTQRNAERAAPKPRAPDSQKKGKP